MMNVARVFLRGSSTLRGVESARFPGQVQEHPQDSPFNQWSRVIKEAEKIVGYPTSFMNLRWLLSDEVANMALHLRKLVGSDHPLLKTAKNLLYSEHNQLQPWGLVILLLSKSVKHECGTIGIDTESNGVLQSQRMLAELTEMIRTGHLIHKGLVNVDDQQIENNTDTNVFGNKIGLLTGDYLLVTANGMLAKLKNQDLSFLISSALRDLAEGEFFGDRDPQNFPLPGKPLGKSEHDETVEINWRTDPVKTEGCLGNARKEWSVRNLFGGASLLGRGCQSSMLLAGQSGEIQRDAFLFGCNLGLAWQAASELTRIKTCNKESYSLVSAPVLFALEDNVKLYSYILEAKNGVDNIDFEDFKLSILKTDALNKTQKLYEEHGMKAMEFIDRLGNNESIDAIKKILSAAL